MRHSSRRGRHARMDAQHGKNKRRWLLIGAVFLIIVLAAAVWIGVRALMAKKDLDAALPLVSQVKAEILAGNSSAAIKTVSTAATKISDAKSLTSDPVWRAAEIVPWAGQNLRNVRELTDIADGVFVDAVTPLSSVAKSFSPASLKPKDGAIDVAPFVAAKPVVAKATKAVVAAQKRMQNLDTSGSITQVREGAQKFSKMIDGIAPQMQLVESLRDETADSPAAHSLVRDLSVSLVSAKGEEAGDALRAAILSVRAKEL